MLRLVSLKIRIDFFRVHLTDAVGPGVYEISITKNKNSKTLYIGESFVVLVRCATHLYLIE